MCGKTLVSNQSLKNHMLQVHEMGQVKSEHKCTICEFSFPTKQQVNRHIQSVHEKMKPYQCTMCESSFSLKVS